ncbi:outer membrane protein transport protein [Mucilaginibacter calamicampi]|uniref:Outer membrane protein transport protein n=1 Tax=Mucilaginibacter calamicampi TaxID=1302352 RepID=A0ABW2YYH0_9SPHI
MIKYIKFLLLFLLAGTVLDARSQSTGTTSSPYSRYGIGDLNPQLLPQNMAMGGIGTAIGLINGYSSVNPINPASYSTIGLTTIDAGLQGSVFSLSQTGQTSQRDANFRLSHLTFGIPVTRNSALAFGLMPYSEIGYNYTRSIKGFGSTAPADTNVTLLSYKGEGGLSKAFLGYGFAPIRSLRLGANISYIFGNLKQFNSTQFPNLYGVLNTRDEQSYSVGGVSYDYGAQYQLDLSLTRHIVFAYSAAAQSNLNSQKSHIVSHYKSDELGNEGLPTDSVINIQNAKSKIQLPNIHHFGISYQRDQKFLVGLDYTMGNWSALTIDGANAGMSNSKTLNIGGQITPNLNSINSYWATVDYRAGFILDQTYFNVNNVSGTGQTNIKSYAATFGFGLPLRPVNGTSFYKINIAAEVGRRGTIANGLVRENYFKIRLGFTLNDRWFQRYKFD